MQRRGRRARSNVTRSKRPLQIDGQWVFWRSFWIIFVVCQIAIWHHLRGLQPRGMGRRNFLVHMVLPSTFPSLFLAVLIAMAVTLLVMLIVRLIIDPALRAWLTPAVDPTTVLFHLAPGEESLSSVPARRRWGWNWQPGTLVLTDRRVWFVPLAWNLEPCPMDRHEIADCELERSPIATLFPICNWPEQIRIGTRSGGNVTLAVADPKFVIDWFQPGFHRDKMAISSSTLVSGAFDG
jgi:hypothetical protein